MSFIVITLLILAALNILFRTLALSPLSTKLTKHMIWKLDTLPIYGWLVACVGLPILVVSQDGLHQSLFIMAITCIMSTIAVWLLPPRLVNLFWSKK